MNPIEPATLTAHLRTGSPVVSCNSFGRGVVNNIIYIVGLVVVVVAVLSFFGLR